MLLPEAVIFDMDGLMLDTETISMRAMRKSLQQHEIEFQEQWLFDIIGMNRNGMRNLFHRNLGYPLPEDIDGTFIGHYEDHINTHGIEVKTGLRELLDFLQEKNIRKAVATSTRSHIARKKLGMTGILDYFEIVVCGDQVHNGKPAPDIYLKAADQLGVSTDNSLALEDSDNGAKAANSAGIDVIVVPDLKQPADHTRNIAHMVVESLHDVKTHLASSDSN